MTAMYVQKWTNPVRTKNDSIKRTGRTYIFNGIIATELFLLLDYFYWIISNIGLLLLDYSVGLTTVISTDDVLGLLFEFVLQK